MKKFLVILFLILPLWVMAQPLEPYRHNFFTTNPAPVVDVVAGSNTVVTPSLIGTSTRRFTVSATATSGQTNWSYLAITNLSDWSATNHWNGTNLVGFLTNSTSGNAATSTLATNAINATNFWGTLSPTNLPAGIATSNYVGSFSGNGSGLTNLPTTAISPGATNQVLTQTGWSGYPQITNLSLLTNAIGTAILPSLWLTNPTPAALGAQQASPALMFGGQGWRSGNSTTMPAQMGIYLLPTQGSSANPTAALVFIVAISNSVPSSTGAFLDSGGNWGASSFVASGNLTAGQFQSFLFSSSSRMKAPANGDIQVLNNGNTDFSRLYLGPVNDSWINLRIASTNPPILDFRSSGALSNYVSIVASNITATGTIFTPNMIVSNNLTLQGTLTVSNISATSFTSSYGCMTMATGTVAVATSTSTNQFQQFSYTDNFGGIGIETNSNFVVTNAARVLVSYGCQMLGGNGDTVSTFVYTNGVRCQIVGFTKVMQNPAIGETGFKEFGMSVPAMCRISLYIGNTAANNVNIQNLCFNVKGAN